jgi:hypothetical protein
MLSQWSPALHLEKVHRIWENNRKDTAMISGFLFPYSLMISAISPEN